MVGRFSPAMARDSGYWQRVIFPTAFGVISESLGVTALHCACVEQDGQGILLAGDAGAGKSTLAISLSGQGWSLLSDDWTYFSFSDRRLFAWGLLTPAKLLPDAAEYFPQLRGLQPEVSLNGELAYEVDPEKVFSIRRSLRCEPRRLVFLERRQGSGHEFARMTSPEAAARLEFDLEDLPPELWQLRESQQEVIQALVARDCWLFRYAENPHESARALARFCGSSGIS